MKTLQEKKDTDQYLFIDLKTVNKILKCQIQKYVNRVRDHDQL